MKFTVEAVARDLKKTKNNKYYSGVKLYDGRWVNVMSDCRELRKGSPIFITEPHPIGDGKQLWAFLDSSGVPPPPSPPPPSDTNWGKEFAPPIQSPLPIVEPEPDTVKQKEMPCCEVKTLNDWARFIQDAWVVVNRLEEISQQHDPQARAALINTAVIAWVRKDIIHKAGEVF